ncbi:hypothetical protein A9179_12665 [Pseudomonas alcaligenes]|uniref:Uncharacterized protein n=1 Tax=Aquipseudomonas alcaligenes TaxID=43263 RepID=A0ABR7S2T9_AQUAC|nr:hypothetical protein [Pseudomonas alcaligenes]MBC9251130.1 hypothetical protein [Pseudomonas alcaligenes]
MTAGLALEVVEYAGIDFFTHAGSGETANGTACQAAKNRASQSTQCSAKWSSYGTYGCATLCSANSTGSACCCTANSTDGSTQLTGDIAGCDVPGATRWAID